MSNIKTLINGLVEEILQEKLRGKFTWPEFIKAGNEGFVDQKTGETIKGQEAFRKYASSTLGDAIGVGSSRVVYALSSSKVLKIAKAPAQHSRLDATGAGIAQNKAEVELSQNPKAGNVLAKVYDHDEQYRWIVMEIARPLSQIKFEKILGIQSGVFNTILEDCFTKHISLNEYLSQMKEYWDDAKAQIRKEMEKVAEEREDLEVQWNYLDPDERRLMEMEIKRTEESLIWSMRSLEQKEEKYDGLNVEVVAPLIDGILEMKNLIGLNVDDIMVAGHYGITGDGRLVVIDYGFTEEIGKKFYRPQF